jgi:hypothetical protein
MGAEHWLLSGKLLNVVGRPFETDVKGRKLYSGTTGRVAA